MQLSPDEWTLVLADPTTNYQMDEYSAGLIHHPAVGRELQPLLIVDAQHVETGVKMRLTIRVPPIYVGQLAAVFEAMAHDLEDA